MAEDTTTKPPQTLAFDQLIDKSIELGRITDPARARQAIDTEAAEAMAKYNVAGVDLEPEGVRAKLTEAFDARWDESTTSQLLDFEQQVQARVTVLERQLEKSRRPPVVVNPTERDLALLVTYRRFEGFTLGDVLTAYAGSTDRDNPTLAALVESRDPARLKRELRLVDDDHDAEHVRRLHDAITERRAAREDADAARELAALTSWWQGGTSFAVRQFIRMAKDGRLEIARLRRGHAVA